MLVIRDYPHPALISGPKPVVTIGNFDGVHQGHQALLSHVVRRARAIQGTPVAITFHPHPKAVIGRGAPPLITTEEQKIELIEALGITCLFIVPFDKRLASMEAAEFITEFLWKGTRLAQLVVGYDFRFGRGGLGHYDLLFEAGQRLGFEVAREGATQIAGKVVSSTLIREALAAGEIEEARLLLGREYFVDGDVVRGQGRGKRLGFPTANLVLRNEIIPPPGVYATWVEVFPRVAGERICAYAATSIGHNPTFGDNPLSFEAHLLDFSGDLYGCRMRVHFTKRLREEQKFDSVEALIRQMEADVAETRSLYEKEKLPLGRRY